MGESLREMAGSSACLRRCNECHFGIGDRRMIGENGDLGQHADAEAGRDSGPNVENVGLVWAICQARLTVSSAFIARFR
jgi:hypothetical protein